MLNELEQLFNLLIDKYYPSALNDPNINYYLGDNGMEMWVEYSINGRNLIEDKFYHSDLETDDRTSFHQFMGYILTHSGKLNTDLRGDIESILNYGYTMRDIKEGVDEYIKFPTLTVQRVEMDVYHNEKKIDIQISDHINGLRGDVPRIITIGRTYEYETMREVLERIEKERAKINREFEQYNELIQRMQIQFEDVVDQMEIEFVKAQQQN